MAHKTIVVTTSWDDGDRADLRLAELLHSRGIPGTFYVPLVPYLGRPALTRDELRMLVDEGFEIGGHGVDHEHMPSLDRQQTLSVVRKCRNELESVIGEPLRMFCYPGGHYTRTTVRCLADVGYRGARTTRMLAMRPGFDRFAMPTTLQAFPHTPVTYLKNTLKARRPTRLYNYMTGRGGDWVELGKGLFDRIKQEGGIWHLYGHSWELEDHSLWKGLAELLDYVAGQKDVSYLTNGDTVELFHPEPSPVQRKAETREDRPRSQQVPTAGG